MKKIILTHEEVYCGLEEFYKNVGKHLMDDIMGYIFDCRHINISEKIQDIFYDYYKVEQNAEEVQVTMLLAFGGPKVNKELKDYEIEVDDKFMFIANYTDMSVNGNVITYIIDYFNKHLPNYRVYEVYHKSNHDDDNYLYMVLAKKNTDKENDYAVWTSWNESTQSLNYGHYDLTKDKAKEVLQEYFFDCTGKLNKEN